MEYILEVCHPDDVACNVAVFKSDKPFMGISKGDYINTTMYEDGNKLGLLEVVLVNQFIFEVNKNITHKIMVHTKQVI